MLRVLIADDSDSRSSKLSRIISDKSSASITLVKSAADARRELFDSNYDLAIIDVVLPTYDGSEPRISGGLSLIEEVLKTSIYKRPSYIVGITAYENAASEAARAHDEIVWKVLLTPEFDDGWLSSISRLVEHIASIEERHSGQTVDSSDVVWVTALRSPEFEAVRELKWGWTRAFPLDTGLYYYAGQVPQGRLTVSALSCLRMGSVEAALITDRALQALRPRLAVMSGICAGLRGSVSLGDIVVATQAWEWQSGKLTTGGGFEPDPISIGSSDVLLSKFQELQADGEWASSIWREFDGLKPGEPPRIHLGPLATGSPVVADSEVTKRIKKVNRKTLGIDMESYGFHAACAKSALSPLSFATVKGVCDFADKHKSDGLQAYAAYVSARAVAEVLKEGF